MPWLCEWYHEIWWLKLRLHQRSWVFQQDKNLKLTSKSTQKWLKTKRWRVLKLQAMRSDLNLIEHLWRDLKTSKKLIHGYRKRLISVIFFSKGGATKLRVPIILSSTFFEGGGGFCVELYQIGLFFSFFFGGAPMQKKNHTQKTCEYQNIDNYYNFLIELQGYRYFWPWLYVLVLSNDSSRLITSKIKVLFT